MKLVDALRQSNTTTENGMSTNTSSLNHVVDLFYKIGAMRGRDKDILIADFTKAFNEDPTRSMKILFWVRDVRGGAGERQIFRDIISYLADNHTSSVEKNLHLIPEYGRWDDLLVLEGTKLQDAAFELIQKALLVDQNVMCAKWMPRKGLTAVKLRNHIGLTPKLYRKLLVELTNVVEQLMCSKRWEDIDFGKLPSLASARYQNAFLKNAKDQYESYIEKLQNGEAKINASAVYPYDIIKSLKLGNADVAVEQWKALPNYLEGSNEMILPVVDVSGSMCCAAGNNSIVTCMDVAVSLGLYISERNEGAFKDAFLTFSANPKLQVLNGDLRNRYSQLSQAQWGMNTNIEATFKMILDQAVKHNVPKDQMPNKILILSDMQFDQATRSGGGWYRNSTVPEWNPTAQQMIEEMYADAGYTAPKIVYWNLNASNGDVPVAFDKMGTALISGFSPAIMTSLLGADEFTPVSIMDKTIMSERYSQINS